MSRGFLKNFILLTWGIVVNQSLDNKADIAIDTVDDGRKVIRILDNNGQHGINIILSTEYIRFDYVLDGSSHTIMKYYINGTSS